jgi:hypothetical protein
MNLLQNVILCCILPLAAIFVLWLVMLNVERKGRDDEQT